MLDFLTSNTIVIASILGGVVIYIIHKIGDDLLANTIERCKSSLPLTTSGRIEITSKQIKTNNKIFHSIIAGEIIENILKKEDKELYDRVATFDVCGEELKLTYIDLGSSETKISPKLPDLAAIPQEELARREDSVYIEWSTKFRGKTPENNPTFVVNSISQTQNEVSVGIGNYNSTISTSDIHQHNLTRLYPFTSIRSRIARYFYTYRKSTDPIQHWIKSLHRAVIDNKFDEYTASIGGSVLVVTRREDGNYQLYIKDNSAKIASSNYDRHVLPSFMFGPITRNVSAQREELGIRLHIVKEYGEELLGKREIESYDSIGALYEILNEDSRLKSMLLESDEFDLIQTGFIIDIFKLRPEFTFALVIHNPIYTAVTTNWEAEGVDTIHIDNIEEINKLYDYRKSRLCAPGLAAVIKGIPKAKEAIDTYRIVAKLKDDAEDGDSSASEKLQALADDTHDTSVNAVRACRFLGDMYRLGRGVQENATQAVNWFFKACSKGVAIQERAKRDVRSFGALKSLSEMALHDIREAEEALRKLSEMGFASAKEELENVIKQKR